MAGTRLAVSAASGGLYGALTPVLALLLLAPAWYGLFSVIYLIFAFGVSLQYSLVSEAWARRQMTSPLAASSWSGYSTALTGLSSLISVGALLVAFIIPELRAESWVLALAVLFAVYRSGARYYCVAERSITRVYVSDLAGIAAFVMTLGLLTGASDLSRVSSSWLVASAVSSLMLKVPRISRGSGLIVWVRSYAREIKPLILDSLLMDAGAIGTPFVLVGFMGATKFGIYRAVSNVAMPVRLLLEPLRPAIGRTPRKYMLGKTVTLLSGLAAAALALGCYLALAFLVPSLGIQLGTLSSLVEFALPSSLFVAGSFLGTVYYIVCRTNSSQRVIILGRIMQTALVVALPIGGFASFGLLGAIWGFALASALSSCSWIVLARLGARSVPATAAK